LQEYEKMWCKIVALVELIWVLVELNGGYVVVELSGNWVLVVLPGHWVKQ
jgi:hypothetical protein